MQAKRFVKRLEMELAKDISGKRLSKKPALLIFDLIGLMEWKYGMTDPSPLMTTLYSSFGKTDIWFRKTEDLSEERIDYCLTFKTAVKGKNKFRKKTFYYPVDLAAKSTSRFNYKDKLAIGWFYCEASARKNEEEK